MIPVGTYSAKADSVLFKTTPKGVSLLEVKFRVSEGEQEGEIITWTGWLTEKAVKYVKRDLETMGFQGSPTELRDRGARALPATVSLVVEHEEYKGELYARVKYVNSAGGSASMDWGKLEKLWGESDSDDDIAF